MQFIRRLLSIEKTDREVARIRSAASKEIQKTSKVLTEVNELQTELFQRTKTYYIAKGMGVVR